MGSGTTGIAAVRQNRVFIGLDKDPESVKTAKYRIASEIESRKKEGSPRKA